MVNVPLTGGLLVLGLVLGFSAGAAPGEECDNGVPVGGTACANQGDKVQYRCQPGSKPGASKWTQESCSGNGTCQGAACKQGPSQPPPSPGEGCDNGVPVGGTACAAQGDKAQYRCQAGSKPGASKWAIESCSGGGTCQGAACKQGLNPKPSEGCDNGIPVGGTACAKQGDKVQYRCQAGSRPGASKWTHAACNGGTCSGTACNDPSLGQKPKPPPPKKDCLVPGMVECWKNPNGTWTRAVCDAFAYVTEPCPVGQDCASSLDMSCAPSGSNCDGKAIGASKCEGQKKSFKCVLTPQGAKWQETQCNGKCQDDECVPDGATCGGIPLGTKQCADFYQYHECEFTNGKAQWMLRDCQDDGSLSMCSNNKCVSIWKDCTRAGQKLCVGSAALVCSGYNAGDLNFCAIGENCFQGECFPCDGGACAPKGASMGGGAAPTFKFSGAGPIPGMTCTNVNEAADPAGTWGDNFFCASRDIGMRWSSAGPIAGMRCTQINEPAEPSATTWNDNFLCVPPTAPITLKWSYAGPIAGKTCVAWNEVADPHTWSDNFACY